MKIACAGLDVTACGVQGAIWASNPQYIAENILNREFTGGVKLPAGVTCWQKKVFVFLIVDLPGSSSISAAAPLFRE